MQALRSDIISGLDSGPAPGSALDSDVTIGTWRGKNVELMLNFSNNGPPVLLLGATSYWSLLNLHLPVTDSILLQVMFSRVSVLLKAFHSTICVLKLF